MKNKQGCVDWLVEEINKQKVWADPSKLEPIIQQAKAMHKEEIQDAYYMGDRYSCCGCYDSSTEEEAADYYNEIYLGIKKEEQC